VNRLRQLPAIALLASMVVIALALTSIAAAGHLAPGDRAISDGVQSLPGEGPEEISDVLAFWLVEALVWLAAMTVAWRQRNVPLLVTGVLVVLALTANPIIKDVVDRARPTALDVTIRETDAHEGFPSGHVQAATLMYGFAWYSLHLADIRPRAASVIVAAVVLVIGFDRIYNGAHWPSDVLGGFAYGVLLLGVCVIAGGVVAQFAARPSGRSGSPTWA
jgi:membrane-associated phospholipid phosphatase